jgi:hypothetical protein
MKNPGAVNTGASQESKIDDKINSQADNVHSKGSWNETDSDRPKWTYDTKVEATYDYSRADGKYAYSIVKGRNPDGSKTFKTMRHNLTPFSDREPGDKSQWHGGQGDEPKVLYRLPELIEARIKNPGVKVVITEGEKDADTAVELGFVATCNSGGALNWLDEFSLYLTGTDAIVCRDNDKRGIEHAKRVAASIAGYAKRARILAIPGYKDLTEWKEARVGAGKTIPEIAAELTELISAIKDDDSETIILSLEDWLKRDLEPADFICGNILTTTSRTIVDADTGLGKTLWTLALSLSCAAGLPFMHWPAARPIRVLYVDGEMSRRVMKERLEDAVRRFGLGSSLPPGMHMISHEDVPDGEWQPLNTPAGQALIEKIIARIGGVDLIVFDNIMALIEGDQKDEEGWRKTMPWIRKLTRQRIAQIWINHTGIDTTRAYGTKTREWQMDNTIHFDREQRTDTDVSFNLTFRKARERTPATRDQFCDVKVALVNDQWTWQASSGTSQQALSPLNRKFYEALCAATAKSGRQVNGCPAAAIDQWKDQCVGSGLIDPKAKPDSARTMMSKARLALIAANWIACNETDAWTRGPNSEVGPM